MRKPIIEFVDFSFQYKAQSKPTLSGINLTIYEGEKVLIVGPSGSGKSTLAHCINGLIPFYYEGDIKGRLKICGKDVKDSSIFSLSENIGTVLQDADGQFIGLTVGEDISFKLENNCLSQREMIRKVQEIAKLVQIDKHLDMTPHDLSGGQKQRVTLAGVMVDEEQILLFDEPLASLDPATGKRTIELIDQIQKETNKTIIIIEHRLEDVLHRSVDRIIVMNEGEMIADINSNQLLQSNLLEKVGIREPLYVTALKYANCSITTESKPEHIDLLKMDTYEQPLKIWYKGVVEKEHIVDENPVLELQNVSFRYTKKKAILKNISFKINKGEMVSIVGQNGAGKSTISKLICGFYPVSSGQILINNRDVQNDSIKERAHKVGMVLQNPNQMISKTMIFDEVAFGLQMRNFEKDEIIERVNECLKICGLYEFRNWPISALSFGQKKRVTIASILVLKPEVIILDEPTAGQDFKHYTEIMEFLKVLNENGVTIIMITHDMHLMLEYTNRAIVIANGEKIDDDTAINVLSNSDVVHAANLKETSLHKLAEKAKFPSKIEFVSRFIQYDRSVRRK